MHDTFPEHRLFNWQIKYGAFGVSVSLLDKTIAYIRAQEQHHRKMTFQEEFLALLQKHRIPFDESVSYGSEGQPSRRDWKGRIWRWYPTLKTLGYCREVPPGLRSDVLF